jgi:prepilin-type N-terminal cleavage/methylation domain-containing protein
MYFLYFLAKGFLCSRVLMWHPRQGINSRQRQCGRLHKSSRGFTLVELLVVIAIIALLLSALMTSLSKVCSEAKTTICKSNLHQWGLANMTDANDYNGKLPWTPTCALGLNMT